MLRWACILDVRRELKRRREQEREPLELWVRRWEATPTYAFYENPDLDTVAEMPVEFFEKFSGVSLAAGECVRLVGFEMKVEKE